MNTFYKGDPVKNGFRKETAHIPLLVGSVFGEFGSFAPTPYNRSKLTKEEGIHLVEQEVGKEESKELLRLFQTVYPERNPVDILTMDFLFRKPEIDYIRERSRCSGKVWSYLFNLDMNFDGGRTPWHCADIPYFFHNTQFVPYTQEKGVTERVEKLMFDSLMAFAKTGNPENPEVPKWDASTPETESTLVIGKVTTVRENFDHELIPLLKKCMEPVIARNMEKQMKNVQH